MIGPRAVAIELPARVSAVPAAREALDPLVGVLRSEVLEDVRLLVSELVTNSVRHAGLPDDGRIGLSVRIRGSRITVEVVDPGAGFEPRTRSPGSEQGSGWGLYLVERIADRWGVEHGRRTRVWFEIDGAAARATPPAGRGMG